MNILALDCAVTRISLAVRTDSKFISETYDIGMRQSEILVPVIDEIRAVKFTASQVNSTIGLTKISSNQILECSNDLKTWTPVTTETVITLSNIGDILEVY